VYDSRPRATPWRTPADTVVLAVGEYAVGIPEDARVPSLLASMPRDRLALIGRMFAEGDRPAAMEVHLTTREITRREYDAFLRDPFVGLGLHAERNQPRGHNHRPPDWDTQIESPELPVVNVDWWSAYAFASWAGGRLPTAEEWESAASGQGRRIYPWGNEWRAAVNNAPPDQVQRRLRVVERDDYDATPEGLLAMGGNASEWTRSVSGASGRYSVVVKGGNYLLPIETARLDFSNHLSPNHRSPTLGFRVAFDRPR
jgi:formylglycine-generating enzyme required for sulfatase activity